MSHHPLRQRCRITVVMADIAAARTAIRTVPIQGGWQTNPTRSANGKFIYSFWCTTIADADLLTLKALSGVIVTENSDPNWRTVSGFTRLATGR